MIKSFFIGINFFGILLLNLFIIADVTVTQNLPTELEPGGQEEVSVTFSKGNIEGFAKYQVTVDEGLEIEVVEGAGASYTFNNNKAKFIWMALPAEKTFVLKYRIKASMAAAGALSVTSRFSYIKDNERRNFDLDDSVIRITGTELAETNQQETTTESANESAVAEGSRTVYNLGHNQYRVDIVIKKSDLEGFAKIEENIPDNFAAVNIESQSAVFSVTDKKVKFIWFDIPAEETLKLSYKLLPEDDMQYTEMDVEGELSFLQNEQTVTIPITSTTDDPIAENTSISEDVEEEETVAEQVTPKDTDKTITVTEDMEPVAEEATEPSETEEDVAAVQEQTEEQGNAESTTAEETARSKTNTQTKQLRGNMDGNIANVPDPEEGVYYRVQIAAGKNNLDKETFTKLYRFEESLKLEYHGSWYKYTTGYHEVYKQARDDRERIKALYTKFQGPFVTAYNDGERITVQEALMITSQKWYQ